MTIMNIECYMLNVEGKKMLATYFLIKSDTNAVYFVIQHLAFDLPAFNAGYISQPMHMMEMKHEEAGELIVQIRYLTKDYTPPRDACTTFRISIARLKAFEKDLHCHIHLDNNILFPRLRK